MVENRRVFLRRASMLIAGVLVYAAVGCDSDIERKTETVDRTVAVGNQPLIPEEFKDKDSHKIVNDEIFKRLGIPPSFISPDEIVTEAGITFKTESATFSIVRHRRSYSAAEYMGMTYLDHKTQSQYAIALEGRDSILIFKIDTARVISGEKATTKEAGRLKKNMAEILIESFNEIIKNNGTVGVHYSYYHSVPKATATPSQ